jgi:hypothetical protein
MNHAMIDLETLGTKSNAVIMSIAAVQFDIRTGKIGKIFKININLEDSIRNGRKIDSNTLQWWMKQRPEIFQGMFESPTDLHIALSELTLFFQENHITHPWGNSALFDLGTLRDAYDSLNLQTPWSFYHERCYRTMASLLSNKLPKDKTQAHDPVYDCKYQIKNLVHLNQMLGYKIQ